MQEASLVGTGTIWPDDVEFETSLSIKTVTENELKKFSFFSVL